MRPRLFLPVLLATLLAAAASHAQVVAPAPDLAWVTSGGKRAGLKDFRGQPVIVLVAPSPRSWAFRSQIGQLQKIYSRFANVRTVCIAAFTQEDGEIRSNIPFVRAADPAAVAGSYGVEKGFGIFILGKDGNIDCASSRVLPAQRVLDIINNSYVVQRDNRRG